MYKIVKNREHRLWKYVIMLQGKSQSDARQKKLQAVMVISFMASSFLSLTCNYVIGLTLHD